VFGKRTLQSVSFNSGGTEFAPNGVYQLTKWRRAYNMAR
jgi:hypothetical protein